MLFCLERKCFLKPAWQRTIASTDDVMFRHGLRRRYNFFSPPIQFWCDNAVLFKAYINGKSKYKILYILYCIIWFGAKLALFCAQYENYFYY